jgi:hypothetical protein
MTARAASLILALALAVPGCGESGVEPPQEVAEAIPIPGLYEVEGETVDRETGEKRKISGTVILAVDGDRYTATYHLATIMPGTAANPVAAEVIGKGSGELEGRSLRGTNETQLVVATVPGVDPGFAFIPRQVSTRLVSSASGTVAKDGTATLQVESQGAPGACGSPRRASRPWAGGLRLHRSLARRRSSARDA